jgi:ring-1,2-phenylacetyl-CoA epoxidase subunit PaaD
VSATTQRLHPASSTRAWAVVAAVPDPELPMLTLGDLGILRDVQETDAGVVVVLTPTYSGCPAMREMSADAQRRLHAAGYAKVEVRTQLQPAWTTDWITEQGRRTLAAAGIAPPQRAPRPNAGRVPLTLIPTRAAVRCPQCGSADTVEQSRFGATACRALYRCGFCREPFEHLKAI